MASAVAVDVTLTELTLTNEDSGQNYTLYVPHRVYNTCCEDKSGVLAGNLFNAVLRLCTTDGVPKVKTLDHSESTKVLTDLNLIDRANIAIDMKASMPGNQPEGQMSQVLLQHSSADDKELNSQGQISPTLPQLSQLSSADTEVLNSQERVNWAHEAVLLLIERRHALSHLFDTNTKTQRQAWRKVAEELQGKGYTYTAEDCSKKFRSLRGRHKTIKEKNKQTGNNRQAWRYFEKMEEMFAGDPAIIPTTVVSSLRPIHVTQTTEAEPAVVDDEQPPTPRVPRKRRRLNFPEEPPQWFENYLQAQKDMHNERMEVERRRLGVLENISKLLEEKH